MVHSSAFQFYNAHNTDKSTCTHCMYAPTKHFSIHTLLNTTVSTRFRFVALLFCQNLSIMGETEKAAAEAAVVPPPQQPAALPLGPQTGVKYPIQESHFVVSRPCVTVLAVLTIYSSTVLCLSFVLSYSCRPVIFLSYLRNAELFFMF